MIAASHLTRTFGMRTAVDDVSLSVERSEIVALLGPNGAGKTTTMRMLAGLLAPTSGSVAVQGVQLTASTGSALRSRIGFLTEAPGVWDRLTIRENMQVYAGLYALAHPVRAIDRVLALFELTDRADSRAAELSKGMRQKVALARTLLHDPPVLLLDEPTSGLDPEISRSVRRLLEERRAEGCAILLSTHNLDEAERLADRVAVLHGRLLAVDRPASLRRRLATGRTLVRVAGDAARYLSAAKTCDPIASSDGPLLILTSADPDRMIPGLVRALVAAGADIVEVRPEMPPLEDVYLHLVADEPTAGSGGL
jgi:ABC-2 type transport system ATP-binding protein